MSNCIFCQIVAGDIPAKTLYEDDAAVAFLDAYPLTEGHTLVIPKAHHEHLQDVPEGEAAGWYAAVHRVAAVLQAALDAPALTVGLNNGKLAGQAVPHVHMHLIPRYDHDGGGTLHAVVQQAEQRSVDEVFERLKGAF